MKKLISGIIALVLLLVLVACGGGTAPVPTMTQPDMVGSAPGGVVPPRATQPALTTQAPKPVSPGAESPTISTDRMIVRTGDMSLVVEDILVAVDAITNLAESYKGYVVNSQTWREGERLMGAITIRVPAADFDVVVRSLSDLAVEVRSQSTTSQDVTEEYVDLASKLSNLEAAEQQLLKILEKAETVEDILAVQAELTRTRGEIEQTKGRMQYLERTSETSLIQVSLEQAKLDADFNAFNAVVEARQAVQFMSKVAGGFAPYSYEWNFGDGSTSTLAAPTHVYRSSGNYTVTLKVTDDKGNTDTVTRKDYIQVLPGWNVPNIVRSARDSLVAFGQGLAEVLIRLVIWSPVWLGIGVLIYWLWRRARGKFKSWFGGQ
ncbi:MAG: DUF4349 domain-containing protein [Chloroflexota bacterium]